MKSLTEVNEADWDRALRAIIGAAALYFYLMHPTLDIYKGAYLLLGVIGLFTAFTGHCTIYSILGISTLKTKAKREESKKEEKPKAEKKEVKTIKKEPAKTVKTAAKAKTEKKTVKKEQKKTKTVKKK